MTHKTENERIHHNGEDYVPAYWLQVGKDALDRCCGELETAEKRIAALEKVATAARILVELDGDDPRRHGARVDLYKALAALDGSQK